MRSVLIATALTGLGVGSGVVGAQTLAGRVIDGKSRLPTRLLAVQVLDDSNHVVVSTRTDTAGIFYGLLPAGGRFRVHFSLDSTTSYDSEPIAVPADAFVEREFVVAVPRAYFEFEVQKQVQTAAYSPQPRYPANLKAANIEGEVLAQFVVDTTGRAEMGTFRVLRSTDMGFAEAVRRVLPDMRFYPAEIGGRKVRQMVQQPFTFRLTW